MRSMANDLLAAMAFADLALLITMLPHSLAAFQVFAEDNLFRFYYFMLKTHLAALANWFSTTAIWYVIISLKFSSINGNMLHFIYVSVPIFSEF